jgi:peptide/nickel transport system substrate-binding protein
VELYQEANRLIMEDLPGLPYASTEPALAFRPGVEGFEPSPVQNENFNLVTVAEAE